MTDYKFPTEPEQDEYTGLFRGAFPAHAYGGSDYINWQGCKALTIMEAAALSYGMHPGSAIDYVYSKECGTLQRGLFASTLTELKRAVLAGYIRAVETNTKKVSIDTMVFTEDVLNYFYASSCNDNKETKLPMKKKGRRDAQIDLIIEIVIMLEYKPTNIVEGEKGIIKNECLKNLKLFSESGFKRAWTEANKRNLISMENKEIYL